MDLVDLNCTSNNFLYTLIRRDPYGSRGSKSAFMEKRMNLPGRDPYGSRGSKLFNSLTKITIFMNLCLTSVNISVNIDVNIFVNSY